MRFLSNKNLILFIFILLLILRSGFFIDSAGLLIIYVQLIISEFSFALDQMDFLLFDTFLSLVLFVLCFFLVIGGYNKYKILNERVSFPSLVSVILLLFLVFAPVVSSFHPEFQKNISVTKLLNPFSSVITIEQTNNVSPDNLREKFLVTKRQVIQASFNDRIQFVTSINESDGTFRYSQKNKEFQLQEKPVVKRTLFILGTDQYGRDVFSRIVYGARISMIVGFGAVIVSFLLGFTLGFAAGYPGGIVDIFINRIADIFLSFPVIFLIILILALFGNSLFTVIIVLGLSGWMTMFKIVRGEIIGIKKKDFFISARLAGMSSRELMFKEALPVIAVPVVVNLIFQFANVIMAEAALSYLGLGTGGSYPSWGSMIESSQGYLPEAWWMILAPGFLLVITLFAANETGRILRQKLLRKAL